MMIFLTLKDASSLFRPGMFAINVAIVAYCVELTLMFKLAIQGWNQKSTVLQYLHNEYSFETRC